MRPLRSSTSTHWVIWSSPLLLLVLVFTLTASSGSTPPQRASSLGSTTHPAAQVDTSTSSTSTVVTTTTAPRTSRHAATKPTRRPTDQTETVNPTTTLTTSAPSVGESSSVTASNDKSIATASAESVSSGALSGRLDPALGVAVVPLVGPGTWDVATSVPATVTLDCGGSTVSGDQPIRPWGDGALRRDDRARNLHDDADVAVDPRLLERRVATRVHGVALVLYFALLPFVVLSKWRATSHTNHEALVRALLVVLALFWIGFMVQVALNVLRLRRGHLVKSGASVWLAGLVVAMLAVLTPVARIAPREPTAVSAAYGDAATERPVPARPRAPVPLTSLGAVPIALMAKRRSDLLRQRVDGAEELDVEESMALLRARNPGVISRLAQLTGDALDGVLEIRDDLAASSDPTPTTPIVACSLGTSPDGALVGFAREGGRLPIPPAWSGDDIVGNVVALHEGKVALRTKRSRVAASARDPFPASRRGPLPRRPRRSRRRPRRVRHHPAAVPRATRRVGCR